MAGGGSSSSQPVDMTPGAFKNLQGPFADVIGQFLGVGGQAANPNAILGNIPGYTGPLAAPMGANEASTLQMLQQQPYGATSPTGVAANFTQGLMNANPAMNPNMAQFATAFGGANNTMNANNTGNPFLQAAITAAQRPTMQNLTETLGQTLPSQFTTAGQAIQPGGSSAFDRAAAIATRGATQAMSDIAANMSSQDYEAQQQRNASLLGQTAQNQAVQSEGNLNRQVASAQAAPAIQQGQMSALVQNLQSQALPRLINEYGIERGMSEFQQRMNTLLSLIGVGAGTTTPTTSQASSSEQKPNVLPFLH